MTRLNYLKDTFARFFKTRMLQRSIVTCIGQNNLENRYFLGHIMVKVHAAGVILAPKYDDLENGSFSLNW